MWQCVDVTGSERFVIDPTRDTEQRGGLYERFRLLMTRALVIAWPLT